MRVKNGFIEGTPENITELVKKAADKTSWKKRLEAVKELKRWKCQQSKDVLTRLALQDLVPRVQEEAFKAAQALGVTIKGQPIRLPSKPKGQLIRDVNRMIYKVYDVLQEELLEEMEENFNIKLFKSKFKLMYPEAYDVYEYQKGSKFDRWIKDILKNRTISKRSQNAVKKVV